MPTASMPKQNKNTRNAANVISFGWMSFSRQRMLLMMAEILFSNGNNSKTGPISDERRRCLLCCCVISYFPSPFSKGTKETLIPNMCTFPLNSTLWYVYKDPQATTSSHSGNLVEKSWKIRKVAFFTKDLRFSTFLQ